MLVNFKTRLFISASVVSVLSLSYYCMKRVDKDQSDPVATRNSPLQGSSLSAMRELTMEELMSPERNGKSKWIAPASQAAPTKVPLPGALPLDELRSAQRHKKSVWIPPPSIPPSVPVVGDLKTPQRELTMEELMSPERKGKSQWIPPQ